MNNLQGRILVSELLGKAHSVELPSSTCLGPPLRFTSILSHSLPTSGEDVLVYGKGEVVSHQGEDH